MLVLADTQGDLLPAGIRLPIGAQGDSQLSIEQSWPPLILCTMALHLERLDLVLRGWRDTAISWNLWWVPLEKSALISTASSLQWQGPGSFTWLESLEG